MYSSFYWCADTSTILPPKSDRPNKSSISGRHDIATIPPLLSWWTLSELWVALTLPLLWNRTSAWRGGYDTNPSVCPSVCVNCFFCILFFSCFASEIWFKPATFSRSETILWKSDSCLCHNQPSAKQFAALTSNEIDIIIIYLKESWHLILATPYTFYKISIHYARSNFITENFLLFKKIAKKKITQNLVTMRRNPKFWSLSATARNNEMDYS